MIRSGDAWRGRFWQGIGFRRGFGVAGLLLVVSLRLEARQGEAVGARVCVVAPLGIVAGAPATLRVRGLNLTNVVAATLTGKGSAMPRAAVTIKEKRPADVPNGFELKDVGDSVVVLEVTVPGESTGTELALRLATVEGSAPPVILPVWDGGLVLLEKEPNNGFREAQKIQVGRTLLGAIESDRDVDVFLVKGFAGKPLRVELQAASLGSLLDATLTLYDDKRRILGSVDDARGSRDPSLRFEPKVDGEYIIVIQAANDRGTAWHAYALNVAEEP